MKNYTSFIKISFLGIGALLFLFFTSACETKLRQEEKSIEEKSNEEKAKINNKLPEIQSIPFDTTKFIKNNRIEGKYAFLSKVVLKPEDFKYMSKGALRIVRNEIFARYGYIFKSQDLKDYFLKQEWYTPLFSDVNRYITDIEKQNIDSIKKYEGLNPNFAPKKQFEVFLDLLQNNKNIPVLFAHSYNCNFYDFLGPYITTDSLLFDFTSKYKYIVYHSYAPCDQCEYNFYIRKYNMNGELIDTEPLNLEGGITGGHISLVEHPNKNTYKITFEYINSDVYDEDNQDYTPADTIIEICILKLDNNENLTIENN